MRIEMRSPCYGDHRTVRRAKGREVATRGNLLATAHLFASIGFSVRNGRRQSDACRRRACARDQAAVGAHAAGRVRRCRCGHARANVAIVGGSAKTRALTWLPFTSAALEWLPPFIAVSTVYSF